MHHPPPSSSSAHHHPQQQHGNAMVHPNNAMYNTTTNNTGNSNAANQGAAAARHASHNQQYNQDSRYGGMYAPQHHHQQQQQQQQYDMQTEEDAADADLNAGNYNTSSNMSANHLMDMTSYPSEDDDTVPTVFRWEHGGRQVYVTGTFNGWSKQIPMHRSGNDFTYIHNLKKGKHAFKFIVDDEWRFAPDQPTVADIEGRINNFIDVSDFKAYTGDRDFEEKANSGVVEDTAGEYSHSMPDLDEYTKEPPPLPPHLRHIILNKPPQLTDTAALPVPQHVALNHLYCTAIKDNMMVLGITQRYKTKFVTTVYYSPCK